MSNNLPKLIVIVGPTASGKTEAGIILAKHISGEVISADSRQIYTGMNIGTAKPEMENLKLKTKSEKQKLKTQNTLGNDIQHDVHVADLVESVKHYLFNIRQPDDQLTLAEWQEGAFKVIDRLIDSNTPPLLVGGTMLYVDSIVFNYDIPSVEVNKKLREDLQSKSTEALFEDLLKRDPQAIDFVQPENKRRIIRAIEVIEATGKPFSGQRKTKLPIYDVQMIGLFPGWEALSDRIQNRVKEMLEEGLIEETIKLQDKYGLDLPLLQTINYKQVASMLEGELTKEEAIQEMIRVNTRYARRQMSWWRGRAEITWIDSPEKL